MITFSRLGRLGRFGNRLFQYAGTRLYAELNGFSFAFPAWEGDRVFRLPRHRTSVLHRMMPTIQLDDLKATSWSERLLSPLGMWKRDSMARLWREPHDNINLYGYLQDEATLAMLRGHSDMIRQWLTFNATIDNRMREAVEPHERWVAVHIRRGDMIKRNAETDPIAALGEVRRLAKGRPIFIASDDPSMAASLADSTVIHLPALGPTLSAWLTDFWMLRNSELLVGSGSTYAWWAAFLGNMEYWAPPLNHSWNGTHLDITQQTP